MEEKLKILFDAIFSADFNANDFFGYALAAQVTISSGDMRWVLKHIGEWGQEGLDSALAYVQNQEPLDKWKTEKFEKALEVLIKRKQKVIGDIDWKYYFYREDGPYRKIQKL